MKRPRSDLHPYQREAIEFLKAEAARQLIALMGSGKTTVAEHTIAELKAAGLLQHPALVVAPLLIAETVWQAEAALWEDTAGLTVELIIGTPKQRLAALDRPADLYVTNYDNIKWLAGEIVTRRMMLSVLIADEASKIKNPEARRTKIMLALGGLAQRRWTLTGTPRGRSLLDVWGPAQMVTGGIAFPAFYSWRAANFFTNDIYERNWFPRAGVERAITEQLRPFTYVVDQAALNTRPPVVEIVHSVPLDPESAAIYQALDTGGTTNAVAAKVAQGLLPASEMAIVTKLQQVCSGASYNDTGTWTRLHDRRLDMLGEIHAGHDKPTLVFIGYKHELERIRERFPYARELTSALIEPWNRGEIEMLVAHPASAGHGINLQGGSDTIVWFSLPWSAELFAQGNARIARQGQRSRTVTIHLITAPGRIDEIALRVVHARIADQNRVIAALQT